MTQEYTVLVGQTAYPVVVSDERKALLAAKAAGRVFVGLMHREDSSTIDTGREEETLWEAEYLATSDAICPEYLERIVRRHLGLPWMIAETDRLILREFMLEDIAQMPQEPEVWFTPEEREADRIFYDAEKLEAYIKNQYRFYEYGIWAVVRKEDGIIVGKAGVTNAEMEDALELGYHIFEPYRRQGYAKEACRAILHYAKQELDCPVSARVAKENGASIHLLEQLQVPYHLLPLRSERG